MWMDRVLQTLDKEKLFVFVTFYCFTSVTFERDIFFIDSPNSELQGEVNPQKYIARFHGSLVVEEYLRETSWKDSANLPKVVAVI